MSPFTTNRKKAIFRRIVVAALLLLLWEIAARLFPVPFLLAGPVKVLRRLTELIPRGEFWINLLASSLRILGGLLSGIVAGVFLAILAMINDWLDAFFEQFSLLCKTVPITVITVLLLILFSNRGIVTSVVFIMVFPILFSNYRKGLAEYDRQIAEVAFVYQWSRKKRWKYIYMRSAEPYFKTGMDIACGMAWKAGIAAEILAIPQPGIGERIYRAKVFLESADIFAYTLAVILLSLCCQKIITHSLFRLHRKLRGIRR